MSFLEDTEKTLLLFLLVIVTKTQDLDWYQSIIAQQLTCTTKQLYNDSSKALRASEELNSVVEKENELASADKHFAEEQHKLDRTRQCGRRKK
ncbi:unnamed protein product [Rotaria magnacalcarata]